MKIKFIGIAIVFTILLGCKPSVEYREQVEVVTLAYTPSSTSTGVGYGGGGKGGVVVTTQSTPAHYIVIVDCPKHGRIEIDSKRLFDRVKPGQDVGVVYREYWFGVEHDAN